ncbi:MAG: C25 family cysteine peptidase, partial [Armatimonadota bacterium]|nr:C25 family cysteine peptidase [Armatimonadota bacterium]
MRSQASVWRILILALLIGGAPAPAGYAEAIIPFSQAAQAKSYLIVAPQRFHGALDFYVSHKQSRIPTRLVSLEDVLRTTAGVDEPERLKRYLYEAWRAQNVGYVLLVGDVDVLPVRYIVLDRKAPANFNYAFYPSDLYYSDLARPDGSFDDWNARKDDFHAAYFGEVRGETNKTDGINFDQVDYRPDIALGRWPVSTTFAVRLLVAKTLRYENDLLRRQKPGARRAAFFAMGGWVDSRPVMDAAADVLNAAWTVEKRYYTDERRNDGTPAPNAIQMKRLLNQGVGLVCHMGHGASLSWDGCLSRADLTQINNADRLPILMSVSCSTARFVSFAPYEGYVDVNGQAHVGTNNGEVFTQPPPPPAPYQTGRYNTSGIGEHLLCSSPHGAVAYIGCYAGSQPCGLTLLDGFVRAVGTAPEAGQVTRLGDCWSQAVRHYYEKERLAILVPTKSWYPPTVFFQAMKFTFFGDPT